MASARDCPDGQYYDDAPGMCVPCGKICHHPDEQQKLICKEKCPLFYQESSPIQIVTQETDIANSQNGDSEQILQIVLPIVAVLLVVIIAVVIVTFKKFYHQRQKPCRNVENGVEEGRNHELETLNSEHSNREPATHQTLEPNESANVGDSLLQPASNQLGSAQRVKNGGAARPLVTQPASADSSEATAVDQTQVKQPLQPDSNPDTEGSGLLLEPLVMNPESATFQPADDDDITKVKQQAQRDDAAAASGGAGTVITKPVEEDKGEFAPTALGAKRDSL